MIDQTFLRILGKLAAFFPRFELNNARIEAYYDVLGELDRDLLKSAVLQIGSELEGPWGPSAGHIRAKCFELRDRENPDAVPDAGVAWDEVLRLQNMWTPPTVEDFSHPAIFKAYRGVGGARVIGMMNEDMLFTTRSQFMKLYDVYSKREQVTQRMLPQVKSKVAELMAKTAKQLTAKGVEDADR